MCGFGLWARVPIVVYVATGGKKWFKISQFKRKEISIELRFARQSIRLDELIILVYLKVKMGRKITELWQPEDQLKVAVWLIMGQFMGILATFFKVTKS